LKDTAALVQELRVAFALFEELDPARLLEARSLTNDDRHVLGANLQLEIEHPSKVGAKPDVDEDPGQDEHEGHRSGECGRHPDANGSVSHAPLSERNL
jgi:hypothetical protein